MESEAVKKQNGLYDANMNRRGFVCRAGGVLAVGASVGLATGAQVVAAEVAAAEPVVLSWGRYIDLAKDDPDQQAACAAIVADVRNILAKEIIRRVYRYKDVGTHRTWLDGRAKVLEPETQETFALAMSDCGTASSAAVELPLVAAAYRLTGETEFRDRVLAQLQEMTRWSPLQRPGWTCYQRGNRLPPDGKDGAWLATGSGVRAIADALEILPADQVPASLRRALEQLLEKEINQVIDDWETKRTWFVRSNNAITNQWVLPSEGLVRACLLLGRQQHADACQLGMKNMLSALRAHGEAGEFEEGFGYASFTVESMLATARAAAVAGDRRLLDEPFLKTFPTWWIHHLQPGRKVINAFDCGTSNLARSDVPARSLLAMCGACTGSPAARWALHTLFDGPPDTLAGLAVRALPPVGSEAAASLYAVYRRAARVNWRDSWSDDGNGVWIRGGHGTDQHDHQDRGHVNLIFNGRPVLIEAGTPAYADPLLSDFYASGAGHNVLQVGLAEKPGPGWQIRRSEASITVHELDQTEGHVRIDLSRCYRADLRRWFREVRWTSNQLAVDDRVELNRSIKHVLLFRWHLGTSQRVKIIGQKTRFDVTWPGVRVSITGSATLLVSQQSLPDRTLAPRDRLPVTDQVHTCLMVRTVEETDALSLTTSITKEKD